MSTSHWNSNVGRPTEPDGGGLNASHLGSPASSRPEGEDEADTRAGADGGTTRRPGAGQEAAGEGARPADRPTFGEPSRDDRYGRDEGARNPNLDPQPENTPGLDAGGGVEPGETPPESNSASASPPIPAPSRPPKTKTVIGAAVAVVVLLVLLFFVAYAIGLIG